MTDQAPEAAVEELDTGDSHRRLIIGGGVGVIALVAVGGYLLLSGGGDNSSTALPVPVHRVSPTASASASASPSPKESVLPVFHGSVGSRDPFALPAAVKAATAPVAAAASGGAAAATGAAAAAATPLPSGLTLPTSVAGPGGTTVSVVPGSSGSPTTVTVTPMSDQYLQLLAAHHSAAGWTVDVRSATGIARGVKPGTKNVDGTLFFFDGEDETAGLPTFVFELGESKGGNLVPNPGASATAVHADKSTIVLHDGNVDGGVYAE